MATMVALAVCACLVLPVRLYAQSGTVMPSPKFTAFDNNGNPCAGCKLFTYASGTTTPQATFTDTTLTVANPNPVVLDASGRATIYLSATTYKFVLQTAANVTLWTQDGVASISLSTSAIGFELVGFGGDPNSPITATTYPTGVTFDKSHAGTLWLSINAANIPAGTYALEGMLLASGGTVTAALVNLSDGNPDTALVTIASTVATGERQQSSAITFAAAGVAKNYAIKVRVTAGSGFAWSLRLVRIA